jgi:hypothetical protein
MLGLDCIIKTLVPYGRFLVWNKDLSDCTRILVKIRAYNVDTLPMSVVVLRNLTEDGNTDSWTCPLVLLARQMLGGMAGDEDPLPPNGANPHPLPPEDRGFWHDQHAQMEDHVMGHAHNVALGVDNAAQHAAAVEPAAPDTPAQSPPPPDQDVPLMIPLLRLLH